MNYAQNHDWVMNINQTVYRTIHLIEAIYRFQNNFSTIQESHSHHLTHHHAILSNLSLSFLPLI